MHLWMKRAVYSGRVGRRGLCTQHADIPPLSEPLPGLPTPVYSVEKCQDHETKVRTLENGLKVASQKRFGQFCTVGVVIDSGSRYEVNFTGGISHFLEKLAFGATKKFSNRDKILQQLEKYGGICDCQSSRDTFIYAASCDSQYLDEVVEMLAETVMRPQLTQEEIETVKTSIAFELEDLQLRPDQETHLVEMIHAAAYSGASLGLPKLCPTSSIPLISRNDLLTFLSTYYQPQRMVLAGVGVDHQKLIDSANKHFVMQSTWEEENIQPSEMDLSPSVYTGGIVKVEKDLSNVQPGPSPIPELSHIVVALESPNHQMEAQFVPTCVLNVMMGGGGSFSAGGPGKGMYTRLYTSVLNRHHWMYNATAYNHAYADSGLFCIHASAPPSHSREMVSIVTREFSCMTGRVDREELSRAKKQLQSMLLMNLEARPVVFEDVGRQVLATGHRKDPRHFINLIDKVTEDDIRQISQDMLKSPVSMAALGDLRGVPSLDEVQSAITLTDGRMDNQQGRRFSIFR